MFSRPMLWVRYGTLLLLVCFISYLYLYDTIRIENGEPQSKDVGYSGKAIPKYSFKTHTRDTVVRNMGEDPFIKPVKNALSEVVGRTFSTYGTHSITTTEGSVGDMDSSSTLTGHSDQDVVNTHQELTRSRSRLDDSMTGSSHSDASTSYNSISYSQSSDSMEYTNIDEDYSSNNGVTFEHSIGDGLLKEHRLDGLQPVLAFESQILLYTVIIGNTTNNSAWDKISVQGWQAMHLVNETIRFCVRHKSGIVRNYGNVERHQSRFGRTMKYPAVQFISYLNGNYKNDPPDLVTLTNRTGPNSCHSNYSLYLKTSFAYKHAGEIAVFAKVIFGNISADSILSWFEMHSLLGFSKVFIYPMDLNERASKVLKHYEREGRAELIPFAMPGSAHGLSLAKLGKKSNRIFNDKNVALFDGLERLRGYDYVVAIDIDEYLIPKRAKTWRSLFNIEFTKLHPDRAGALFYTFLHLTDWGPTTNSSRFEVSRYLMRTGKTKDRRKHVFIPSRIVDTGIETHIFKAAPGFKGMSFMSPNLGGLHHFRSCREEWIKHNSTVQCSTERIYDDSVYRLFKRAENNIMKLKQKLNV